MTEENYNYRTGQAMLRNQFPGEGKLQIPVIPKFRELSGDFDDLLLIGFDKAKPDDQVHSNPHDHRINWEAPRKGCPSFEKPHINYWSEDYPHGVPEFKKFGDFHMIDKHNSEEENRFKTISEFQDWLIRGGEIKFVWNGQHYAAFGGVQKTSSSPVQMLISKVLVQDCEKNRKVV